MEPAPGAAKIALMLRRRRQQPRACPPAAPCAIHDWMTLRLCSGCRSRQISSSRRLRLRICGGRSAGGVNVQHLGSHCGHGT